MVFKSWCRKITFDTTSSGTPFLLAYVRKYVLEDKVLGLKEAIASMTSFPARIINLKDRGKIAEGNFADIVVFDLNSIRDLATFTDPHQYSKGIEFVLVNGVVSIERGTFTGERGGEDDQKKLAPYQTMATVMREVHEVLNTITHRNNHAQKMYLSNGYH